MAVQMSELNKNKGGSFVEHWKATGERRPSEVDACTGRVREANVMAD